MSTTATSPAEVISLLSAALQDGRIADALALYDPTRSSCPIPTRSPSPVAKRSNRR
jgi:hypothetical protein